MSKRVRIDFEHWPEIEHITRRLVEARHLSGLSQREVAAKLGTAQSYITALEHGFINPTAQVLSQLARLYMVPPASFWPSEVVHRRLDLPRRRNDP